MFAAEAWHQAAAKVSPECCLPPERWACQHFSLRLREVAAAEAHAQQEALATLEVPLVVAQQLWVAPRQALVRLGKGRAPHESRSIAWLEQATPPLVSTALLMAKLVTVVLRLDEAFRRSLHLLRRYPYPLG